MIEMVLCECGCGQEVNTGKRFILGHNTRLRPPMKDPDTAKRNASSHLKTRIPLPDGWNSKLSDITDNRECTSYLGDIAEIILSNIYDNVKVMPRGNHGFDVICNHDYKIDIKASATGDKLGYWMFQIRKNQITDYFLCIAFNSRDDLYNPVHLI